MRCGGAISAEPAPAAAADQFSAWIAESYLRRLRGAARLCSRNISQIDMLIDVAAETGCAEGLWHGPRGLLRTGCRPFAMMRWRDDQRPALVSSPPGA